MIEFEVICVWFLCLSLLGNGWSMTELENFIDALDDGLVE